MQSFGAFFNDNKALAITLILIAGILSIAILIFLYRLLFGRRLHMAGSSRTRQPRLGVVDAFDLDRQRQLVLVRRDNVEHLIMIGGPNDLVIESAFVRMQPNVALPGRDKDANGISLPAAPMPIPMPSTMAPGLSIDGPLGTAPTISATDRARAVPPLELNEPLPSGASDAFADIPAPAPVAVVAAPAIEAAPPPPPAPIEPLPTAEPAARDREPEPEPDVVPPPPPPPVRPLTTPTRFSTGLTRPVGATGTAPRPLLPPRPPTQASSLIPRNPTLGPRPLGTPLTRGTSAASLRRDPPGSPPPATPVGPTTPVDVETPAPAPTPEIVAKAIEPASPVPFEATPADEPTAPPATPIVGQPKSAKPPALPTTLDTLESLEEEMARLLGRPPAGAGKR